MQPIYHLVDLDRETLPHLLFCGRYSGPRLPVRLHIGGEYVFQIPGTSIMIDGASENSPFACERSPAIYANHSAAPNAQLEIWPVLRPGLCELRSHAMLVATEPIEAGQECVRPANTQRISSSLPQSESCISLGLRCRVRINYESGESDYWHGEPPTETKWREARVPIPPPALADPVYDRLQELQAAAASRLEAPPCAFPAAPPPPMPWQGAAGGDKRLEAIVPLLSTNDVTCSWSLAATHVPGRSGRECRDRWFRLQAEPDDSDDDDNMGAGMVRDGRRCCIAGCREQLLLCSGGRSTGSEAESTVPGPHVICAPCLTRWWSSQRSLRPDGGALIRRSCPVCKCELRRASGDVRNSDSYAMGLLKVQDTW